MDAWIQGVGFRVQFVGLVVQCLGVRVDLSGVSDLKGSPPS